MSDPYRKAVAILALTAALLPPFGALSGEGPTHGWKESAAGRWGSLPEIHAGFSPNGISLELTLRPGTGVTYTRTGPWTSDNAALQFSTDAVNPGGNEYHAGEARFPASATFVFGKDAVPLGAKERVKLFFRQMWNGFRPSGIRLTYAWGTRLPVGSMYRLWEEETVFILAGPEEVGKKISTARRLKEDFQAAYGRPPKGPVTKVLVEAQRPSGDKGPAHTSITVRFPAD
jgi:hypothetical protein